MTTLFCAAAAALVVLLSLNYIRRGRSGSRSRDPRGRVECGTWSTCSDETEKTEQRAENFEQNYKTTSHRRPFGILERTIKAAMEYEQAQSGRVNAASEEPLLLLSSSNSWSAFHQIQTNTPRNNSLHREHHQYATSDSTERSLEEIIHGSLHAVSTAGAMASPPLVHKSPSGIQSRSQSADDDETARLFNTFQGGPSRSFPRTGPTQGMKELPATHGAGNESASKASAAGTVSHQTTSTLASYGTSSSSGAAQLLEDYRLQGQGVGGGASANDPVDSTSIANSILLHNSRQHRLLVTAQWFLLFPLIVWTWDAYECLLTDNISSVRLQLLVCTLVGLVAVGTVCAMNNGNKGGGTSTAVADPVGAAVPEEGSKVLEVENAARAINEDHKWMDMDVDSTNARPDEIESRQVVLTTRNGVASSTPKSSSQRLSVKTVEAFASILVAASAWIFLEKLVEYCASRTLGKTQSQAPIYGCLVVANFLAILAFEKASKLDLLGRITELM